MSVRQQNLSTLPAKDDSIVNLSCLLLLQSGSLETSPGWGNCECTVCREHRERLKHPPDTRHPAHEGA